MFILSKRLVKRTKRWYSLKECVSVKKYEGVEQFGFKIGSLYREASFTCCFYGVSCHHNYVFCYEGNPGRSFPQREVSEPGGYGTA